MDCKESAIRYLINTIKNKEACIPDNSFRLPIEKNPIVSVQSYVRKLHEKQTVLSVTLHNTHSSKSICIHDIVFHWNRCSHRSLDFTCCGISVMNSSQMTSTISIAARESYTFLYSVVRKSEHVSLKFVESVVNVIPCTLYWSIIPDCIGCTNEYKYFSSIDQSLQNVLDFCVYLPVHASENNNLNNSATRTGLDVSIDGPKTAIVNQTVQLRICISNNSNTILRDAVLKSNAYSRYANSVLWYMMTLC